MRVRLGYLRRIIREATTTEFASALDAALQELHDARKKVELAHELAPSGQAKAIVAGLHSDLFNQAAEFRKHVAQLKRMS